MRYTVVASSLLVLLLAGCAERGLRTLSSSSGSGGQVASRSCEITSLLARGRRAPADAVKLERATNPDEAMRWRRLRWRNELGEIPPDALRRAHAQRLANLQAWAEAGAGRTAGVTPQNWVERGPANVGGRTRSLLIDPRDSNRLWAGAVSGGIWTSGDGGLNWELVDDWLPNLAVCCLAFDPNNPDIMYAGTGEGFFNGDALGGAGIYKSTDAGRTWEQLPATADWDNVCRIAVSPEDGDVILAARRYHGIFRSSDGGDSWSNPYWAQGSFYVAFNPEDASEAIGQVIDWDWDQSVWYQRALYSTDGGLSWTPAGGYLGYVEGFGSRIELAYAPGSPNIVYASCAADGGLIWRSLDGGQTYTLRTVTGSSGCSWYANPLWVDPTDPDHLLTGGCHVYKSTDGGVTLAQVSSGYIMTEQVHPDIHFFAHDPGFDGVGNRRLWVCTDGGVFVTDNVYTASTDSGWSRRDTDYRTTQFYGAAGDGPSGRIIGGTQDNGTLRVHCGSDQANMMFGGDGGFCAIDPTDPTYCYGEYINLMIHRSTNGGQSAGYIYDGIADAGTDANFIAPFILDPNDPNTMLAGGRSLWCTHSVKPGLGHPSYPIWEAIRGPGSDRLSAIAVAPGDSDVIWVGQNNGEVAKTVSGSAADPLWQAVDDNGGYDPLPNRYITRILIDPDDAEVVYVCLGGFSPDNLYRTADGGETWTDITGAGATGLPDAPINGIARHPARAFWLYVGTEVGIFATTDGGETWSTSNDGPANASVDELVFMHNSSILLAATHGRGLFTVDLQHAVLDLNEDGEVDLEDFGLVQACLAGPSVAPETGCAGADFDEDLDVDIADVAVFARGFQGPSS